MTTILAEKSSTGELKFEFSDKWQVCKYDKQDFYKKLKGQGLKGVDFIALSNNGLLFMEVKYVLANDEKSRLRFTENSDNEQIKEIRASLTSEQLKMANVSSKRPYIAEEVSKKVRDTLLGLFASYREGNTDLSFYMRSLIEENKNKRILVLLFLERNDELNELEKFKLLATNLKLAIEQNLRFLGNIQVDVINNQTLPSILGIKLLEKLAHTG